MSQATTLYRCWNFGCEKTFTRNETQTFSSHEISTGRDAPIRVDNCGMGSSLMFCCDACRVEYSNHNKEKQLVLENLDFINQSVRPFVTVIQGKGGSKTYYEIYRQLPGRRGKQFLGFVEQTLACSDKQRWYMHLRCIHEDHWSSELDPENAIRRIAELREDQIERMHAHRGIAYSACLKSEAAEHRRRNPQWYAPNGRHVLSQNGELDPRDYAIGEWNPSHSHVKGWR